MNNLDIDNRPGAVYALNRLTTSQIDLAANGSIQANGAIAAIRLRYIEANTQVSIAGSLGQLVAQNIEDHAQITTGGNLGQLWSPYLGKGTLVQAGGRIGKLTVPFEVRPLCDILAGNGGIGQVTVGSIDSSLIASKGPIGSVLVRGDMTATSIVSNIGPGPDNQYGTADDVVLNSALQGMIGSVRIGGQLGGSPNSTESFGIEASSSIHSVKVGNQDLAIPTTDNFVTIRVGAPLGATLPDYSVAQLMGWTSAPTFSTNVAYTSGTTGGVPTWSTLKVIDYSPSHYPYINQNGAAIQYDGTLLNTYDTYFSNAQVLADFPDAATHGPYVNYLHDQVALVQGLIYDDLQQLYAAGFRGVRLYGDSPLESIATILAAQQLSQQPGNDPFYVCYEVPVTVATMQQYLNNIPGLFTNLTWATPAGQAGQTEGQLQVLHYVINIVGAKVFSQTVPVVYFGHEDLIGPSSGLTPSNCSVPLIQWGINATRSILQQELGNNPLPAVTNALLAGLVVDGSEQEITNLMQTIQTDPNAPIAYDVYPFQYGSRYYNVLQGSTYVDANDWTTAPPAVSQWQVADTVTKADLQWSLQWMTDQVNQLWHPGGSATAYQIIAETGWASSGQHTLNPPDPNSRYVVGDFSDAQAYYNQLLSTGFEVNNVPVVPFEAFDEPLKAGDGAAANGISAALITAENHYGIFGWSGIPKYFADSLPNFHPLTTNQNFAILTLAPYKPNGFAQNIMNQSALDTAYSLQINSGTPVDIPWYWGSGQFSDGNGQGSSLIFQFNPSVLVLAGDVLTITSQNPGTLPAQIQLKCTSTTDNLQAGIAYITTPGAAGETLTQPTTVQGSAYSIWGLYFSFPWLHNNDNSYANLTAYPAVYQDFWGTGGGG